MRDCSRCLAKYAKFVAIQVAKVGGIHHSAKPITVYNAAQIAPPSPRGPSVPPNTPTDLRVELDPVTGALTLKWKASQPRGVNGVVYNIRRRVGEGGGGGDGVGAGDSREGVGGGGEGALPEVEGGVGDIGLG